MMVCSLMVIAYIKAVRCFGCRKHLSGRASGTDYVARPQGREANLPGERMEHLLSLDAHDFAAEYLSRAAYRLKRDNIVS